MHAVKSQFGVRTPHGISKKTTFIFEFKRPKTSLYSFEDLGLNRFEDATNNGLRNRAELD